MMLGSRTKLYLKSILVAGVIGLIGFIDMAAMASERFSNNGDGTVTDAKTGLMWAAHDNGIPIHWLDALAYCQKYSGGGYSDWRLPTLTELANLFDPQTTNRRGYHIIKLIDTSAQSLWASETRGFEAARFNFAYGQVFWLRQNYSGPTRALPVRNGR